MKYVIIINGKPECGKDTFVAYCLKHAQDCELGGGIHESSVTPIKNICRQLGWNGEKTDYWRSVMSDLKAVWIKACDGPMKYILETVLDYHYTFGDTFIFLDIREISEINKTYEVLKGLKPIGIRVITLLIKRPWADNKKHGNVSDDRIGKDHYNYTYSISNDGDLDHLKDLAATFIDTLIREEQ